MIDTGQERISRIAAKAKWLSSLPHDEWLAELHKVAKGQRKANRKLCRECPEKCYDTTPPK